MANNPAAKRRKRRWIIVASGILLILLTAWGVVEFGVQIDRYRPRVEAKLEEYTGLPTDVGRLDLSVLRGLSIAAYDVTLGEGELVLQAPRVLLWPRVGPLLEGKLQITSIAITKPQLRLPADPAAAKDQVTEVIEHIQQRAQREKREQRTTIDEIAIEQATVYQGRAQEHAFESTITIADPSTESVSVSLTGTAPYMGRDAKLEGQFSLHLPRGKTKSLEGTLQLSKVDLAFLSGSDHLTGATMNGAVNVSANGLQRFEVLSDGAVELPRYPALGGTYGIEGYWQDGTLVFEKGAWVAPGLQATLSGQWRWKEGLEIALDEATLQDAGLQALLAKADSKIDVNAPAGVALVASDAALTVAGGDVMVARANVMVPGIDITNAGEPFLEGVSGRVEVRDNVLRLAPLRTDNVHIEGAVTPDWTRGTWTLDLRGAGKVNQALLARWIDSPMLSDVSGDLTLNQLKGTYQQGQGVPEDLVVEAAISNGRLTLRRDDFAESITEVAGTVGGTPGSVKATASGRSESLGTVEADVTYTLDSRALEGTAMLPLQNAAALADKLDLPEAAAAVAASYGPSRFTFAVQLPLKKGQPTAIIFDRDGEPEMKANLALVETANGSNLGDVDAYARFPAHALKVAMPENIGLQGTMDLIIGRKTETGRFFANADLTAVRISLGDLIEKREGKAASVEVAGAAAGNTWRAQTADIRVLEERLQGRIDNNSLVIEDMDVDVAALAPLLNIPGAAENLRAATGRITGKLDTGDAVIQLTFHEVALPLTGEIRVDDLTGTIKYADGALAARDLRLDGLNSELVLNAAQRGKTWEGSINGKQLDINSFLTVWRELGPQFETTQPEEPAAESTVVEAALPGDQKPWVEGELDVVLDQVFFEDATLDKLRARILLEGNNISIENLKFVPEKGEVSGRIEIRQAVGKGSKVYELDLELDRVDAGMIEDLQEKPPRGVEGTVSGEIDLALTEEEGESLLADAEGTIHLTGHDGTFGKMGFATKVLGVLKTTGIFSLRSPVHTHSGLFYRRFDTTLEFDNGVMEIEDTELRASSYKMRAKGVIDFDDLESEVRVNVDLLEGATGLVEKVPLVGQVVGLAKKPFNIRLLVTGSPYDPKVRQNLGQRAEDVARSPESPERRVEAAQRQPDGQQPPERNEESSALLRALTGAGPANGSDVAPEDQASDD